jgi:TonB family protein
VENESRYQANRFSQSQPHMDNGSRQVQGASYQCSVCGTPLDHGGNFCYSCGTRRDDGNEAAERPAYEPYPASIFEPVSREQQTTAGAPPVPDFDASAFANVRRPPAAEEVQEQPDAPRRPYRQIVTLALLAGALGAAAFMLWKHRDGTAAAWQGLKQQWDAELMRFMYGAKPALPPAAAGPVATPRPKPYAARRSAMNMHQGEAQRPVAQSALAVRVQGAPSAQIKPAVAEVAQYPSTSEVAISIASAAETETRASNMRIQVSPRESLYLLLKQVPPVYPPAARAARKQGAVVLKAIIGRDGLVKSLEAISGDALLAPAAMDAVRQWQYRPYYRDGQPFEVETMIVVEFSLAEAQAANRMP